MREDAGKTLAETNRLASVDYLRGLAAFSVLWFHFTNGDHDFLPDGLLKSTGTYGYAGVAVFFVISGFVIPYALDGRPYRVLADGGWFLVRRIVRLQPPYLISLLLTMVLLDPHLLYSGAGGEPPPDPMRVMALHSLYLVPWFKGEWLNPVYWTLAIEFQYYIAMALFVPALLSPSRWVQAAFLFGCLALSLTTVDERVVFTYLPLFGLGFVHFLRVRRGMGLLQAALWSGAFLYSAHHAVGTADALFGLAALIGLSVPWPRLPPLSYLGAISYSLYLVHVPVGSQVLDLAHIPDLSAARLPLILVAVIISLASAGLFWLLVERPSIIASRWVTHRARAEPSQVW